ncbi:MAG: ion transporter [Myxococcales bacterium]
MSQLMRRLADSAWFQNFVTGVILFAGALVGAETYPDVVAAHETLLHTLDKVVLGIFLVEVVVKLGAEGSRPWRYFRDPWNAFDFTIVATAFLPVGAQYVTVLRLLRLLRVLRLIRAIPRLQILVNALLKSIPSMFYVTVFLLMLFYVYAVAGTFLFSHNDPVHFGTLGTSLLSLFRVVTLEGWTELLYIQMRGCAAFGYDNMAALCTAPDPSPASAVVYFVSFILLGTMIVLNLFIGVITNSMAEAQAENDEAAAEAGAAGAQTLEAELEDVQRQMLQLTERMSILRKRMALQSGRAETVPPTTLSTGT